MKNKILRTIRAQALKTLGNPGLLYTPDERDIFDDQFGLSFGNYKPKYNSISYYRYDYNQSPNNTCTQCAVGLALSEQMSVRFSIDAITKLLVSEGKISRNGFCSQQPPMGAVTFDEDKPDRLCGLIPYHIHPDKEGQNWSDLRLWTKEVQRAYQEVAPDYRMTTYKRLRSEESVIEALDAGFVPIIASKWHSETNKPLAPNFFLRFEGYYIGGHQYRITGYRKAGADYQNGQTFGSNWGEQGKSYNETLFGSGYYEAWIVECNGSPLFPMDKLLPLFLLQHENLMVKAHDHHDDPRCYVIENGTKRHVSGSDNMRTFQHLEKTVGLTRVNKTVLEAVPLGQPYPLI